MNQRFSALVYRSGAWLCLEVPFDVQTVFGSRGRFPIKGTINGFEFRSSLFSMGNGRHMMLVNKTMQKAANIHEGDTVQMEIDRDLQPRKMDISDDLLAAIKSDPKIKAIFDKMPYSHQKEYIDYLYDAKKPETRLRRVAKILQALHEKA
jgi:hypothetical protein